MSRKLRSLAVLAAASVMMILASACTTAPPAGREADQTFAHLGFYALSVAGIEIVDEFMPSMNAPYAEHLFPYPPYKALRDMVEQKFQASGGTRRLRVVIEDAAVKRTDLPQLGGLRGALTREYREQYDARLALRLVVTETEPPYKEIGTARVEATRFLKLPEGTTLAGREDAWQEMTEAMVSEIHASLGRVLTKQMPELLLGGPPGNGL